MLFSSNTEEWSSPIWLYKQLDEEFHFDLDPCTTEDNPLQTKYFYTINDDGLEKRWKGSSVFVNPPYNTEINEWLWKANHEMTFNPEIKKIVFLLPVRSDTRWWHKYIYDEETHQYRKNVNVRFIKGRLKFGNAKNTAPFPSCIVIFSK